MPYYHVWFATRGCKWLLQADVAASAKALLVDIASEKPIVLIECEAIVDHVHLLLDCEDKSKLIKAMHLLKGVSSHRLFQAFPELKLDAETSHVWQKGYGSKIVSDSARARTANYIRTQWDRTESFDCPNALKP